MSETVERKFKGVSVYWCTSFSSQQEFFPCFIITARLPIHKCRWREAESPPDVISSTFTYNHIEHQHGFRCDGPQRVHYTVHVCTVYMFTYIVSNRPQGMNSTAVEIRPPKHGSSTSSKPMLKTTKLNTHG